MGEYLNYHGLGHFKERDDDRYLRKNEVYDIPWLVDETSTVNDDDLVLIGKISDKGMYATTASHLLGGVDFNSVESSINDIKNIIGDTDISTIGDGTVTGAISANTESISTNTESISANTESISTNAANISANAESISNLSNALSTKQDQIIYINLSSIGLSASTASSLLDISQTLGNAKLLATVNSADTSSLYSNGIIPVSSTGTLEVGRYNARARATYITDNGYLYTAASSNGSSADFSTWRGVVTSSIGSAVGSSSIPVYINSSGVATASSSTIGGTARPMYLNSGTMTACSSSVGSGTVPVYMSSGTITASSSTVGSGTKPIYMSSGTITASSSTVGSGTKPIYLSSGTMTASSSTVGGSRQPVYLNSGTITACSSSVGYPSTLYYETTSVVSVGAGLNLVPSQDDETSLGTSNSSGIYRYKRLYATESTINTSDEREKTNIEDIDERYENLFVKLRPVNYMWKNFRETDNHDRVHCGLIAQEVEQSCEEVGLSAETFAALCHDEFEIETYSGLTDLYGMAYSELHGLEIHMIQKCLNKIEELENKITELESA